MSTRIFIFYLQFHFKIGFLFCIMLVRKCEIPQPSLQQSTVKQTVIWIHRYEISIKYLNFILRNVSEVSANTVFFYCFSGLKCSETLLWHTVTPHQRQESAHQLMQNV